MTFDEQHGWVDRGTRGVHSGAVVRDVDAEVMMLRTMSYQSRVGAIRGEWGWDAGARRYQALAEEVQVHQDLHDNCLYYARHRLHKEDRRFQAGRVVFHKLALLAPYIAILRAGDEKRQRDAARRMTYAGFDVGQDSTTVMTTYAVEGDTLRIVHTARMPLPAQTVNVTMTIGGE